MTTRGERQLLNDHYLYNKNKKEIMETFIGNAWTEGVAMGVVNKPVLRIQN